MLRGTKKTVQKMAPERRTERNLTDCAGEARLRQVPPVTAERYAGT